MRSPANSAPILPTITTLQRPLHRPNAVAANARNRPGLSFQKAVVPAKAREGLAINGPIVSTVVRASSTQPRKIAKALPRLALHRCPSASFAKSRPSATASTRACRRQEADRRRLYACLCFALLSVRAASGGMRAFPDCSPSILVAPPARMESSQTPSPLVSPNPLAAPRC